MYQKLKSFILDDTVFGVLVVALVGVGSFGLGRLSMQESTVSVNSVQTATVLQPLVPLPVTPKVETPAVSTGITEVAVVASKSGTKYHLPTCPGAKQIKLENRVEFSSVSAAKAAGYTPAANCPGL